MNWDACHGFPLFDRSFPRIRKECPGSKDPGRHFLTKNQQQVLLLQPQLLPQLPQPLLPQQNQMMISRMMIQQQLPPPKPLLHI